MSPNSPYETNYARQTLSNPFCPPNTDHFNKSLHNSHIKQQFKQLCVTLETVFNLSVYFMHLILKLSATCVTRVFGKCNLKLFSLTLTFSMSMLNLKSNCFKYVQIIDSYEYGIKKFVYYFLNI